MSLTAVLNYKERSDEEILKTWTNMGCLEKLNDEDAMNVAKLMENMAAYLLESDDKYSVKNIATLVFPMIRRAYSKGGLKKMYTPERMCEMIERTFIPFTECIKTWGDDIDAEAEYCAFFADLFSNSQKI